MYGKGYKTRAKEKIMIKLDKRIHPFVVSYANDSREFLEDALNRLVLIGLAYERGWDIEEIKRRSCQADKPSTTQP